MKERVERVGLAWATQWRKRRGGTHSRTVSMLIREIPVRWRAGGEAAMVRLQHMRVCGGHQLLPRVHNTFAARKKNMQRLTRCNTAARPQGCRRGWKHGCTENEDTCFGRESALSREFTHEHTRSSTPQPCAVLLPKMPQQQSAKMRGRKALDMCVVILRT
jgi:hypothetical protein